MEQLELIHLDIREPVMPTSAGGARYWLTFIDDFTRGMWIYFINKKSESLQKLQKFIT